MKVWLNTTKNHKLFYDKKPMVVLYSTDENGLWGPYTVDPLNRQMVLQSNIMILVFINQSWVWPIPRTVIIWIREVLWYGLIFLSCLAYGFLISFCLRESFDPIETLVSKVVRLKAKKQHPNMRPEIHQKRFKKVYTQHIGIHQIMN